MKKPRFRIRNPIVGPASPGTRGQRAARPVRRLGLLLLAATALGACSDLLDVEAPSRIEAEILEQPENAPLLVADAVTDFECAFSEYIIGAGLLGDELQDAQLASAMWPYDQRTWNPETNGDYATATCNDGAIGVYTPLSTARWQADNALEKLDSWTDEQVPGRMELIATAAALAGYSYVLMGEAMCSAAFDLGPERTPEEIFQLAEERFTRAIETAMSTGQEPIEHLALLGRARARLNLGQLQEAAADAREIPEGFVYDATYSGVAPRRENDIYTRNIRQGGVSVEADFRDLEYEGVPDPRVNVEFAGISTSDQTTELWVQDKFADVGASIPIASWDEAQLIIAEAEGGEAARSIINMFHERAGLPPFESTDPDEIMEHLVQERARELFMESHHLGDKRRYGLPFTPAPGTPYPPKAGGFYGDLTCFPLPAVETMNNPNIG